MPEPGIESGGSGESPQTGPDEPEARGIGSAAASTLGSLFDYVDARLGLFLLEARETRGALIRRVIAAVAGIFFLLIAYGTLLVAGIALLSEHFSWSWPLVTLAAGGAHLVLGALLLLAAKSRKRRRAFRDSLEELKRDRDWLRDFSSRK